MSRRQLLKTRRRRTALIDPLEPRYLLAKTIYVDASSPGPARDGTSWSAAYADLQLALSSATTGDTIKVAHGTYKPTSGTDRTIAFQPPSGVSIYGGYAGVGSPTPDLRDTDLYPTTLTGNIGSASSVADNSYHVIYVYYPTANITLDGLNITAGNANGSSPHNSGGGIYCTSGGGYGLIIRQCTFLANAASSGGGGAYFLGAPAQVAGCAFRANTATNGGALYVTSTAPLVINTTFVGNAASGAGGAIYAGSSPTVSNCTITANSAPSGSGLYVGGSGYSPKITNSILWANTTGSQIGIFLGSAVVTYSDVQAGYAGTGTISADPAFTRAPSKGADGKWGTADDDYGDLRLLPNSPCLDAGSNAAIPVGVTTDLAGRPRLTDVPAAPNAAAGWVDMGAYEFPISPVAVWLDQASSRAFESAGTYLIGVTLSSYADVPVTIPIAVTGGTASAADYGLAASITVPAGQSTASIPVTIFDDQLVEPSETLQISLGTPDNAAFVGPTSFTLTILDNDLMYVDAGATGGARDGSSWANAFTDLQAALAVARAGSSIRVAGGTYKPTATSDRKASFWLKSDVTILGGYAGGADAADPDARDPGRYPAILSGDIGIAGSNADNSFHVVTGQDVTSSAVLDGFTITGGNASGTGQNVDGSGGGLYNARANPTITNCTFIANAAGPSIGGGAIYNIASSPTLVGCTFIANRAASFGGAIYNNATSSPTLIGCAFYGNYAETRGGAFYTLGTTCHPVLVNCIFAGNSAMYAAAMDIEYCPTTISNCVFTQNVASKEGGAIGNVGPSSTTIANCIFWDDVGTAYNEIQNTDGATPVVSYSDVRGGYVGTGNINTNPGFRRSPSRGPDNAWGTADDDYGDLRLLPGSPGIDAGSNAAIPAGVTTDLAGNPRTYDFPGAGTAGAATVDMGAYELTQNLGSLRVAAGQTVALPAGGYAFSATQVIVDPGGTLDLADGSLLIDYTGTSPVAAVRSALFAGRNGGAWNGTGIVSSAARTTANRGIGYAEAADLGLTTFAGQAVDATALLLKYTVAGDANLDGRINGDDYALTDRGRAKGLGIWVFGDFDYDAAVTGADYTILNAAAAPPPAPAPTMVAPPASEETEAAAPVAVATAAVEPASAPSQVVAPAKPAVAHAKKPTPAKAKPVPVAKAKAKPKPAPKTTAKPTSVPHAAVIVRKAPPAGKSAHPVSGRSPRG